MAAGRTAHVVPRIIVHDVDRATVVVAIPVPDLPAVAGTVAVGGAVDNAWRWAGAVRSMVAPVVLPRTAIMTVVAVMVTCLVTVAAVMAVMAVMVVMAATIIAPLAAITAAVTVRIGESRRDGAQGKHRGNGASQKSIHAHENLGVISDFILPIATE